MTRTELVARAEASIASARGTVPSLSDPTIARAAALVADGLAAVGVDYLTYRMWQMERADPQCPARRLAEALAGSGLLAPFEAVAA